METIRVQTHWLHHPLKETVRIITWIRENWTPLQVMEVFLLTRRPLSGLRIIKGTSINIQPLIQDRVLHRIYHRHPPLSLTWIPEDLLVWMSPSRHRLLHRIPWMDRSEAGVEVWMSQLQTGMDIALHKRMIILNITACNLQENITMSCSCGNIKKRVLNR